MASDPLPDLHAVLAEAIHKWDEIDWAASFAAMEANDFAESDLATAVIATLREHRDLVLDAIGMEQVGWTWWEPRPERGRYFAENEPAYVPGERPVPVYASLPATEGSEP